MALAVPRLAADIRAQSDSLNRVLQYQLGEGCTPLQRAAELLGSSRRVLIVGLGASLHGSIPLQNLLCSRGLDASTVEAGELLHYRLGACGDATCVLVSRSGESIEIVKVLAALRARVPLIAVTNEPHSTLARQADVAIDLHSLADEMVAVQTYGATLLTLYLLGMAAMEHWDEGQRSAGALLEQVPGWIAANLDSAPLWDRFLQPDTTLYALGRGPSLGSARQSALLFSEIAKSPAVGMSVASFRHGPVEVLDERFRAVIFAPPGPTRELNLALARELTEFGGSVRVIGPHPPEDLALPGLVTPKCADGLAPLMEIVPMQVAALRLAQLKGLTVGSFRFAPQVARDESRIAVPKVP